ncbi:MAG: hypothetical protein ABL967_09780 [Bryobacteraceae bacterium]
MKRIAAFLLLSIAAFAQNRDGYRSAYQDWRSVEPNLEKDAASSDGTLGARADKSAAAAAKYAGAKKDYAEARAALFDQALKSMSEISLKTDSADQRKNIDAFLSIQSGAVTASVAAFGNDPDRAIQQLRQTMITENAALAALAEAVKASGAAAEKAVEATEASDAPRAAVARSLTSLSNSHKQAAAAAAQQATSLAAYYRTFAEIASGATPPAPVSVIRPAAPSVVSPAGPAAVPASPAAAPARTVVPVPLSRYTGAWTFMRPASVFLGMEPEFVDLVVHEEQGQITGTLYARFKTAAGTDPLIRFDFTGSLRATRNQTFPLLTSDSANGTIELIPGPAFNLLEVNFKADAAAGKIRNGNFILVKK